MRSFSTLFFSIIFSSLLMAQEELELKGYGHDKASSAISIMEATLETQDVPSLDLNELNEMVQTVKNFKSRYFNDSNRNEFKLIKKNNYPTGYTRNDANTFSFSSGHAAYSHSHLTLVVRTSTGNTYELFYNGVINYTKVEVGTTSKYKTLYVTPSSNQSIAEDTYFEIRHVIHPSLRNIIYRVKFRDDVYMMELARSAVKCLKDFFKPCTH